ncbi:MAG: TAT-variant-translocated molybdopterin oxidoreductase [Gemmataceae bacterium]
MKRKPIDPELLRDRLAAEQGKQYWRSLDELAGDPAVTAMLQREFPDGASEWTDPVSRRQFLMLMGASIALAGATGCRPPTGKVIPFVRPPEDNRIPGKALFYATAMPLGGYVTGLLVESNEGRPTKIEGNPQHPMSEGGTSAIHQAATLGLYDPDRSKVVSYRQQVRTWGEVIQVIRRRLNGGKGEGFAFVTDTIGSPTLAAQIEEFKKQYPAAKFYRHEPVNDDHALLGSELAFGRRVHSYAKLENADVIVALQADFLAEGPGQLVYSRAFGKRRKRDNQGRVGGERGMNRVYAIETDLTVTGAVADNRLALKPSEVEAFAFALAAELELKGAVAPKLSEEATKYVKAIAKDLKARKPGSSAILVGPSVSPAVHAVGHAINLALGNVGQTIIYTEPLLPEQQLAGQSIREFAAALENGEIDTVVFVGSNPAYSGPADLDLAKALAEELKKPASSRKSKKDWLAVHMGLYFDETARLCHWHIPQVHFLEDWSDGVGLDGTACIIQPLIAPLYDGKSLHDLIGSLTKKGDGDYDSRSTFEMVRDHWKKLDDNAWVTAVHDGYVANSAAAPITPTLAADLFTKEGMKPRSGSEKGVELLFAPEPGVYDGRFANNGWLQEWPRPLSRLTWDNALIMSPATAEQFGLRTRIRLLRSGGEHGEQAADMVKLTVGKHSLEVAIWIMPGHADGAVTLHLGYGRTHAGKVGTGYGFSAYKVRTSDAAWVAAGVEMTKLGKEYLLACVQGHHSMEGRDLVRSDTLHAFEHYEQDEKLKEKLKKKGLNFATRHDHLVGFEKKEGASRATPLNLYEKQHHYTGYKWGMAIDLSACTGCGACVVACQAENNSPVIGKTEVTRGREMHWIRIDRYFKTGKPDERPDDPLEVHFQPVMCQHCEQAPCELVCPVEATVHGDEGTNDMVYNRCVGTRYCANNCPYKVRRFNFFSYADYDTPSIKLVYNPEVTVRTRGVVEKCTFCIQRIAYARIEAAKEAMDELALPVEQRKRRDTNGEDGKPRLHDGKEIPLIRDGEVQTACQTACPSEAIVFGDLNDKNSKVAAMYHSPLNYSLMGELGTRPRVTYLAALRNPNPELTPEKNHEGHH